MNILEYGKKIYEILHACPEKSGKEYQTGRSIQQIVKSIHGFNLCYSGKYGLVYSWGTSNQEFEIGFRAELDALEMPSKDMAHACGHDMHMAALIQCMSYVKLTSCKKSLLFIFQSSEESGNGADHMVKILKNLNINVNVMIGLHNAPEIPVNSLAIKNGHTLANNLTNYISFYFTESERYSNQNPLASWSIIYEE